MQPWTSRVQPGDVIFVGSSAGEPAALIDDLLMLADTSPALTVMQFPHGGSNRLLAAARPNLRLMSFSASPDVVALRERNSGSYSLETFSQSAKAIRNGSQRIDVALVQVAPADADGRFSLGISVDVAQDAARRARLVVAQVNRQMPRTMGDCFLDGDDIDVLIESDRTLPTRATPAPDESSRSIAQRVAGLIPAGATIQTGVGETAAAVLGGLGAHRDLTIHTGLFVEPMIALIDEGIVNGRFGRLSGRLAVANQAAWSTKVGRFVHDNSALAFMPTNYTHNPAVLREQHLLRTVNGALEVDLFGRVNSEYVSGRRVGSSGGLLDFVRAAHESDGGRSIIGMRSTTERGGLTKVVSQLNSPGCTIDADLADFVVTEHGVAELRGAAADDRIQRMLEIADPAHRDRLAREAAALS